MEGDDIVIILFPEYQLELPVTESHHLFYYTLIREVRVSLEHVLVVEHQLIEYRAAVHLYAATDDAAVRIQPDMSALTHDGTLQQRKQIPHAFCFVGAQERRIIHV